MKDFSAAVVLMACALGVALADSDAIAQRKELMKGDGAATKKLVDMVKGAPFDLPTVQTSLKTFIAAAAEEPKLFPDDSKSGGGTNALPAIWENKADFNARFEKFGKDAEAALTTITDEASFKANIRSVLQNCGGCHELYKAKSS